VAERLEHLVVVAVLGEVVVPVGPEAGEDVGGDRAPPALAAPVVVALPPRRDPGAPEPPAAAAGPVRHPPDLADLPPSAPRVVSLGLFIIYGEEFGGGGGGGVGRGRSRPPLMAAAYCNAGLARWWWWWMLLLLAGWEV
jgi:hypothetical protein